MTKFSLSQIVTKFLKAGEYINLISLEGMWKDMMTRGSINVHEKFCNIRTETSTHRFVLATNQVKQTKAKPACDTSRASVTSR